METAKGIGSYTAVSILPVRAQYPLSSHDCVIEHQTRTTTMTSKFYYLRDKKNLQKKSDGGYTRGNPVAVIATSVDVDKKLVHYAIASTHPKDHFVKSLGRQIVSGRLEVTPIELMALDDAAIRSGHEITKAVMLDIVNNASSRANTMTLQAAKTWLKMAETPKAAAQ